MKYLHNILTVATLLGTAFSQTKLKIMPLGDSITEITCWRPIVWDNLAAAGLTSRVQFVGSMTNNPQNCAAQTPGWDLHHEGHSGYLAIDIANNYLANWLAAAKPDVVMFMLGTNDVAQQARPTSEITAAYTKMVGLMRASNPNMKIIIDTLIALSFSQARITELNNAIPAWAQSLNTTASPIYVVDCSTGFTTAMLRDGVHPNAQGDALIASRISPVLIDVVKRALATATATATATAPRTTFSTVAVAAVRD
ncbi:cellulose-binding protein [Phlyctema vagabunda]|uniref:Cellulose-binding protein n=1 Tax=Phlyctema vagabunda TaxID=108571 RepID=A0ABR4PE12_9HELO